MDEKELQYKKFKLPKLENMEDIDDPELIKSEYIKNIKELDNNKKDIVIKSSVENNNEELEESVNEENKEEPELINEINTIKQDIKKVSDIKELVFDIQNNIEDLKTQIEKNETTELIEDINNKLEELNNYSIDTNITQKINELIDYGEILENRIELMKKENSILVSKILKKILNKEVSEHSEKIIINTFKLIYEQIKESQKIELYVSPPDFIQIKEEINKISELIKIEPKKEIKKGNCLIISDKGNYDNNIEKKLELILESIY